jgi:hypothetical protein
MSSSLQGARTRRPSSGSAVTVKGKLRSMTLGTLIADGCSQATCQPPHGHDGERSYFESRITAERFAQ